ncbi:hypothetical protein DY000_02063173 [Brassica cretica]|uniref:Uncharacterized protein n=1 Tax=Brassica cretica TaxID=69181 RepID=A0ABQ7B0I6_BRACR|nr:hypothetical protein DY000_02063173 [Brassica cretica]
MFWNSFNGENQVKQTRACRRDHLVHSDTVLALLIGELPEEYGKDGDNDDDDRW